jgi:hypothetical protein
MMWGLGLLTVLAVDYDGLGSMMAVSVRFDWKGREMGGRTSRPVWATTCAVRAPLRAMKVAIIGVFWIMALRRRRVGGAMVDEVGSLIGVTVL